LQAWRRELLAPLSGDVLEVGAGTGANLEHYGQDVQRLVLCEPDASMRTKLSERTARTNRPTEVVDSPAQALRVPDATFDAVVSTLVLCSVPRQDEALSELRRVLKPGGTLVFLEHVLAVDNPPRMRWQQRLEPLWTRVIPHCHITRDTERAIWDAGFRIETCARESMRKAIPLARPTIRGLATKPAAI
jgi:ubiquinone/menaquinone biosynthesis C-methylase UbiE